MKNVIKVTDRNTIGKKRVFVDKIVSYANMGSGWDTKMELLGGYVIYVKETVEQIDELIDGSIDECDVKF